MTVTRARYRALSLGGLLVLAGVGPRSLPAQAPAPVWRLAEHLATPDQWTVYGRDEFAGIRGLPVTSGDFNADGLDDLAFTGTLTDCFVVLSDGRGGEVDLFPIDPEAPPPRVVRLARDLKAGSFNSELFAADLNADGFDDLILGSQTNNDGAGAVYIVWGSADWGGQAIRLGQEPPEGLTVTTLLGLEPGQRVGLWVSSADADGDGVADLLFSADQWDRNPAVLNDDTGRAFVLYGMPGAGPGTLFGEAGQNNVIRLDAIPSGSGLTQLFGIDGRDPSRADNGDHFGSTMAGARLDANDRAEVLVSAALLRAGAAILGSPDAGGDGPKNDRERAGEAYIVWDDAFTSRGVEIDLGLDPPESLTIIYGPRPLAYAGEELWTGDLDGDGRRDLLIGGLGDLNRRGAGWVIYNDGNLKGRRIDLAELDLESGTVGAGGAVIRVSEIRGINDQNAPGGADISGDAIRAADLNGDGFDDLMYGFPNHSRNSQVLILFGAAERLPPLIDLRLDPTAAGAALAPFHPLWVLEARPGDTLSYSMHVGDFNGDGRADLLVNGMIAPGRGGSPAMAGNVYFVSGAALSRMAGAPLPSAASRRSWIDR